MRALLDADVLIGALDAHDAHHAEARGFFADWQRTGVPRVVGLLNLSEVLVLPAAERSLLAAAREAIAALGVTLHEPTEAIGVDAARLRRRHPISLADAYCLATARSIDAQVVSFDRKLLRAARDERLAIA